MSVSSSRSNACSSSVSNTVACSSAPRARRVRAMLSRRRRNKPPRSGSGSGWGETSCCPVSNNSCQLRGMAAEHRPKRRAPRRRRGAADWRFQLSCLRILRPLALRPRPTHGLAGAVGVGEGRVTDLVVPVETRDVSPVAAGDRVSPAAVAATIDAVVAVAAVQRVTALAATDLVVAVVPVHGVDARAAEETVVVETAVQFVVAGLPEDRVVAGVAVQGVVVAATALD